MAKEEGQGQLPALMSSVLAPLQPYNRISSRALLRQEAEAAFSDSAAGEGQGKLPLSLRKKRKKEVKKEERKA